ncbi:MAG TPA: hypothetical protein RMH99_14535 [Sandaracinaceae bacterium LLY-WYZ-13_1]|nr:hypothetical protein [Sandaracinaceae bacterium LLY-WYZ-13_1]
MRRRISIGLLSALVIAGCGSEPRLVVDVVTDLRPGTQFTAVRVDLGPSVPTRELPAAPDAPYDAGVQVADFRMLSAGVYPLTVQLLDGETVRLQQRYSVPVEGARVETVVLSTRCLDVRCPREGDDPGATECVDGVCVEPRCLEIPDVCTTRCESDDDCAAPVSCAEAACVAGGCLALPRDDRCPGTQRCDPETGCFGGALVGDPCDPGSGCGDALICCGGRCAPPGCDDGNPCTDDACTPDGCAHSPQDGPCDDGLFCNGDDACADGVCGTHAGDPCAGEPCDEAMDRCVACRGDADCPVPSETPLGACTYGSVCAETGTRTVRVTTWTCEANECVASTSDEPRSCSRDTDGDGCLRGNTCVAGGCRCAGGSACGAGRWCYPSGCAEEPTYTLLGVPTPSCIDLARAPDPGIVGGYVVTGPPGARIHKYNAHTSCGGGYVEGPETGDAPTFLDASGEFRVEIDSTDPVACDLTTLGRFETYVTVDGVRVPPSGSRTQSYYHADCPGIRTCAAAATFCP